MFKKILKIFGICVIALTIAIVGVATVLPVSFISADAIDLYWYPVAGSGTGNWNGGGHWATAADGTGLGHADPLSTNPVHFTSQSFTAAGQTVTVNSTANCAAMDWTGATNNPTLAIGAQALNCYGDATLISAMSITSTSAAGLVFNGSGSCLLTTNGLSCTSRFSTDGAFTGTLSLADNLNTNGYLSIGKGTFTTNNHNVTCSIFEAWGNPITLNFGASIINCSLFAPGGANFTLSANTSTINCSGNFDGRSKTTYNIVNLTGATSTIAGTNTFAALGLTRNDVQTITFTDGSTQTVTNMVRDAGTSVKTLQGSGAGGWNIAKAGGGYIDIDYLSISRSAASPASTWYASTHSTDGGNNSGWTFSDAAVPTNTTQAATGVTMNKDGVTGGTFHGNVTDLGGATAVDTFFQYGLTLAYGSSTATVSHATGAYTAAFPTTLTPGATYHYRAAATNGAGTGYGADQTFTFTMPSVTTGSATGIDTSGFTAEATISGSVTSMGMASNATIYIEYGYTTAYGNIALTSVAVGAGNFSTQITGLDANRVTHYRIRTTINGVSSVGSDASFSITLSPAGMILRLLIPLILAFGVVMLGIKVSDGNPTGIGLSVIGGLLIYAFVLYILSYAF